MTDEEERQLRIDFDASKCVNFATYKDFCSGCRNCMPRLYSILSDLIPEGVKLIPMVKFERDLDGTTERPRVRTSKANKRPKGQNPQTRRRKQETEESK